MFFPNLHSSSSLIVRSLFFLVSIGLCPTLQSQQWTLSQAGTLPEAVSNNAVCEGLVDNIPFVYSFGGVDKTKVYSGIHLKSFRFSSLSGKSERIPDLPDTLGKVAAGASLVKDKIYIIGGYHVFSNGSELSSNKVHRYDPQNNSYLSDGKPIPVAIDDHVQAVWRDSLIYVITGWSDKANVPAVQIYNPANDSWMEGTSTPDNHQYKSFGASGVIRGDTIFYFGGASMGKNFPIQNQLRIGVINPESPAEIEWSVRVPDEQISSYRMASVLVNGQIHWLGGSVVTYNYNGIAYNKSGGVPPAERVLIMGTNPVLTAMKVPGLPMDLRGIASISRSVKYLAGGMLADQEVTDKVLRLEWKK